MTMPPVHRHGDARSCGATTVVIGQSSTFAEGKLWAVEGDINTDGDGQLIPSVNGIFIEGKRVIVHAPDDAAPDDLCFPLDGAHCSPVTAAGSPMTFADEAGRLTSVSLTVAPPILGQPTLVEHPLVIALSAVPLTVAAPTLGPAFMPNAFTAVELTVAAPVFGTPTLTVQIGGGIALREDSGSALREDGGLEIREI